jgi:hypothetical protein
VFQRGEGFIFVDICPDSVFDRVSESKNRRFLLLPAKRKRRENQRTTFREYSKGTGGFS